MEDVPEFLGALSSPEDPRDFRLGKIQAPVEIPETYLPDISAFPIYYQGKTPACGGHAGAWFKLFLDYLSTGEVRNYSPRFVYALCKKHDGIPDVDGTYGRQIMATLKNYGCCDLEDFPNEIFAPRDVYQDWTAISPGALEHANPRVVASYAKLDDLSFEGLKQAIFQNKAVLVLIPYWGNGQTPPLAPPKVRTSGHFVVLYGYDRNQLYFVNSFGRQWGNDGLGSFGADYPIEEGYTAIDLPDHVIPLLKTEISLLRKLVELYTKLIASKGRNTNSFT